MKVECRPLEPLCHLLPEMLGFSTNLLYHSEQMMFWSDLASL